MPSTHRRHFGSVRRLPSKRWQASYWHLGARHAAPHTFATKTDALAWLSSVETDINRGLWLDPEGSKTTVAAWMAHWLATVVDGRVGSDNTQQQLRPDRARAHLSRTGCAEIERAQRGEGRRVFEGTAAQNRWAYGESNTGPHARHACALTN